MALGEFMIKKSIVLVTALLGAQASYANLSVEPWYVNFGRVKVRTRSHTETVRVTNNEDHTVDVNTNEISFCRKNFSFDDQCSGPLAAGATCQIHINFYPAVEGVEHCDFGIYADDEWQETVSLEGRGAI
jgi:hypothetical protein